MVRGAAWVIALAMAASGMAHAGVKKADNLWRWDTVMALRPGMQIDVLAGEQAGAEECIVSSVDDSALTCLRENRARDVRLVFPRDAVRNIWVWERAPDRHVGIWIALALSAALEIAACVAGGAAGGLLVGMIIAVAWEAAIEPFPGPVWMPRPPPPPRPERLRRRVVYEAPMGAIAP